MYLKEYYPDTFFSKYIVSYFTLDTSLVSENITDLVLPDGTFGIWFMDSKDSVKRNLSTSTIPKTLKKSSLFGQKTKAVNYFYSPGSTQSFGIKINPEGLPLFLDAGSKEIKNSHVGLDCLSNKALMELEAKVFEKSIVQDKIKTVEDFMLERIVNLNSKVDYVLFSQIVKYIRYKRGAIRLNQLAEHFNISYKKIERLFQFYLGMAPKVYIRIIRFNSCIHLKNELGQLNLTQLGNEVGFFDQSHFIREFKSFSSLTPKDFFSKEMSSSESVLIDMLISRWTRF
ncbi:MULTISPECIES: helix-turn-helix domain-containing protein [Flavobacteriaceae]|uniref:helix-turn-helix domain-containing protein n=1 Tax=Flavobacteriaceae TaxID=49546 RepID=UPI00234AA8A4|nr:helix-turn-helix domain-containing protein [Muricauda sp. SP22]MDC6363760.1 helix-turn-helix domain-containing protein [Muricauda sp. SP22]